MGKSVINVLISGDAKGLQQALGESTSALGKFGSKAAGLAKTGGLAVGGALAAGVGVGVAGALNRGEVFDAMNAGLGATGADAERFGKIAGDLYAGAWGDSLEHVASAVATTQKNLGELIDPADLEVFAARGIDFAKVLGEDESTIQRTVGQMLRTGLVSGAEEAFDLLAAGNAAGLNRADDLLDTINEYAPAFSRLGIDGAQAFGLLNQGLEAGVFNTDKIGDAFNEFSIRAIDGSKGTEKAMKALGIEADVFAQAVAQGGPAAAEATSTALAALGAMSDQVAQDAAGVALFGSMWEDLGSEAILALNPMNDVLGDVSGAAAELGDTLNDNLSTRFEALKRKGFMALADIAERHVIPALEKLMGYAETLSQVWGESGFSGVMALLGDRFREAWPGIRDALGDMMGSAVSWLGAQIPVWAAQLAEWGQQFVEWIGPQIPPFLRELGRLIGAGLEWLLDDGLPMAVSALADFALAFVEWVGPMVPPMLRELTFLLADLGEWIVTDAAPKLLEKLGEWTTSFLTWVGTDLIPSAVTKLGDFGGAIWEWLRTDGVTWMKAGLTWVLGAVGRFFAELPGRVKGWLSDAGTWLFDIGKAILTGLWDGMKAQWERVKGWVTGIGGWIKDNKGPIEVDRLLLIPEGMAIMEGLAAGLTDGFRRRVVPVLSGMTSDLSMTGELALSSASASTFGRDQTLPTTPEYVVVKNYWNGRQVNEAVAEAARHAGFTPPMR